MKPCLWWREWSCQMMNVTIQFLLLIVTPAMKTTQQYGFRASECPQLLCLWFCWKSHQRAEWSSEETQCQGVSSLQQVHSVHLSQTSHYQMSGDPSWGSLLWQVWLQNSLAVSSPPSYANSWKGSQMWRVHEELWRRGDPQEAQRDSFRWWVQVWWVWQNIPFSVCSYSS